MKALSVPNPVVVVPVHRQQPPPDEQFSLRRCGEVLGTHPIRIVHPAGLDLMAYQALLPSAKPLPVPSDWMGSIRAYNRMMINPAFYEMLADFSHLLIHEPDALVLSDQLLFWSEQPYDYIGAPWFQGYNEPIPDNKIIWAGNSGFSLISTLAIARVLSSSYRWAPRSWIVRELLKKLMRRPSRFSVSFLLASLGSCGLMSGAYRLIEDNCDTFLCRHIPKAVPDFLIASPEVSLRFSWEVNPRICLQLNSGLLPFGIHAWTRYDRSFIEELLIK